LIIFSWLIPSFGFYGSDCCRFNITHKSAISCYIGTEDSGEFALETTLRHEHPLFDCKKAKILSQRINI